MQRVLYVICWLYVVNGGVCVCEDSLTVLLLVVCVSGQSDCVVTGSMCVRTVWLCCYWWRVCQDSLTVLLLVACVSRQSDCVVTGSMCVRTVWLCCYWWRVCQDSLTVLLLVACVSGQSDCVVTGGMCEDSLTVLLLVACVRTVWLCCYWWRVWGQSVCVVTGSVCLRTLCLLQEGTGPVHWPCGWWMDWRGRLVSPAHSAVTLMHRWRWVVMG